MRKTYYRPLYPVSLPVTLKKLSIRGPISIPLKSYPENLQDLTVQCAFTHKLQFPPKLERLCMIFTGVLRLKHFPQSLRYIDISAIKTCRPCTLPVLPSSLHTLKLACGALDNLLTLPESLRVLEIQNFKTKLPKLPQNLHTFSLAYYSNMEFFPQYFLPHSLRILKLSHTEITRLPELPPALEVLDCKRIPISELPKLPTSLRSLCFYECNINYIPPNYFPNGLRHLDLSRNQITNLPDLPPKLEVLDCKLNPITEFPKLPNTLQSLCFSECNIEYIPPNYLPYGLRSLNLSCNQITNLPGLPPKLETLRINGNQNLELPKLPESLRSLDFYGSKIRYIPPNYFPDGLRHLDLSWNEIGRLPDLPPKLKVLKVNGNPNLELPKLPKTLNILKCEI
ncbi:hypothetical protein BKA69DRAFT_1081939 [Paraphysoderma sedebokerense]|nr:hypothetical protein BKA69DRAFT_1081939 [Paraphysoderma sedebokerense]